MAKKPPSPDPAEKQNPFTQEEVDEINDICKNSTAVKKLADRYALLFSEPDKEFYAALAYASTQISTHVFNGTLDIENTKHKALLHIMEKGKAYYESLRVGKEKAGSPMPEDEIEGAVKEDIPAKIKPAAERYATRGKQ